MGRGAAIVALVLLCAGGPLPASADDCPWWKPALACNCCYPWIAEYTAWKDSKPIVQYVPICSDCSWPDGDAAGKWCPASRDGKCNIFGCNCDGGCRSDPDPENRCSPPLTLYFPYDPDKYLYELTKWGPTSSNKPRACGVARPGRRWPGKPDAGTKKIKTFKGCCDLCKRLPRCKRFQLGPKGCALFASKSSGPPKPAKGYIAGNVPS